MSLEQLSGELYTNCTQKRGSLRRYAGEIEVRVRGVSVQQEMEISGLAILRTSLAKMTRILLSTDSRLKFIKQLKKIHQNHRRML